MADIRQRLARLRAKISSPAPSGTTSWRRWKGSVEEFAFYYERFGIP